MTDFFVSYTGADKAWAEWIAYSLEEKGFKVIIQAWDFRPGNNFVVAMQEAAAKADRTIMVLSPDYLLSKYAQPEWVAAFNQDPIGIQNKLVPVMVRPCDTPGMLASIVQIRIAGMSENDARDTLLAGIDRKRAKPSARPIYPGDTSATNPKTFPGLDAEAPRQQPQASAQRSAKLIPSLKAAPNDIEKRRFLKAGFETTYGLFERCAAEANRHEPRIQIELDKQTSTDFRAEMFIDGTSKNACRIWVGGPFSQDAIAYREGRTLSDNGYNDIITIAVHEAMYFSAGMAMGHSSYERNHDVKKMTEDGAAEYLWHRFVGRWLD